MDYATLSWIFTNFGVPGVLVIMLWRAMVFMAPLVKEKLIPLGERIGEAHIAFVNKTSTDVSDIKTLQDQHSTILADNTAKITSQSRQINEIHSKIVGVG